MHQQQKRGLQRPWSCTCFAVFFMAQFFFQPRPLQMPKIYISPGWVGGQRLSVVGHRGERLVEQLRINTRTEVGVWKGVPRAHTQRRVYRLDCRTVCTWHSTPSNLGTKVHRCEGSLHACLLNPVDPSWEIFRVLAHRGVQRPLEVGRPFVCNCVLRFKAHCLWDALLPLSGQKLQEMMTVF